MRENSLMSWTMLLLIGFLPATGRTAGQEQQAKAAQPGSAESKQAQAPPSQATETQEEQKENVGIEQAVAASEKLGPLREEAIAVNTTAADLLTKRLQEAAASTKSGDQLLAKGEYGPAAGAYVAAAQIYATVIAARATATELKQIDENFRSLLTLVDVNTEVEMNTEVLQQGKKTFATAMGQLHGGDYRTAVQTMTAAVGQLEQALLPPGYDAAHATLESAVAARTDALLVKARVLDQPQLKKLMDTCGEAEPAGKSILEVLADAGKAENQADVFLTADEFVKAIVTFVRARLVYERSLVIQASLQAALADRGAMTRQREIAEKTFPAGIRPLAFERALRQQREAETAFRSARYDEAAQQLQQATTTYAQAEKEGVAHTELFAAEKQWTEDLAGVDQEILQQYMPAEFGALLEEAKQITQLRRANDPIKALDVCKGAILRLQAIDKQSRSKKAEAEFAQAFAEAKEALQGGDRDAAQAAVDRGAALKPGDPELQAFARNAGLSFRFVWSFDQDMQEWTATGDETIWHHIRQPTAPGGGCLRAGDPGEDSIAGNANTTLTSPASVNLGQFEKPVLRFRQRVHGMSTFAMSLSIGGQSLWRSTSYGGGWADVSVDLTEAKEKLDGAARLTFTFANSSSSRYAATSGDPYGGYLDEVVIEDAATRQ